MKDKGRKRTSAPAKRNSGDEVTYSSYLALDELLQLQRPRSQPEHPDELLFIIVHQASELWFKLILHELDGLIELLEARDTLGALTSVKRVNALVHIVTGQLSALETLPPQRFAQFRGYLGTSSGSQSVQFRAIEAMSGMRDEHFMQVLKQHGEGGRIVGVRAELRDVAIPARPARRANHRSRHHGYRWNAGF